MSLSDLAKYKWLRSGWWEAGEAIDRFYATKDGHAIVVHIHGGSYPFFFLVHRANVLGYVNISLEVK